jgi:hypothetical protein
MPSESTRWLVCMSSTKRQYLGLSLFLIVVPNKMVSRQRTPFMRNVLIRIYITIRVHANRTTNHSRNPTRTSQKASGVHDQPNLCRSIVDFCLGSRDTRLHKESICLLSEPPFHNSPIMIHNVSLTELPKEILVVCDDNKLKVSVVPSFVDDTASVD